jgi:hypothetical protein
VIRSLFNFIFRCQHQRTTFPQTSTIKPGGAEDKTYVVCLDCGKQFAYDWENMQKTIGMILLDAAAEQEAPASSSASPIAN